MSACTHTDDCNDAGHFQVVLAIVGSRRARGAGGNSSDTYYDLTKDRVCVRVYVQRSHIVARNTHTHTHTHREEQVERTPGEKEGRNERAPLETNRENWKGDRGRGEGVIAVSRAREHV